MQTREPRKRSNWIFVIILIVAIPLFFAVLFMLNTIPQDTPGNTSQVDSSKVIAPKVDSFKVDTTINKDKRK
ncbi:MAG TPA: hypothetical protein VFF33_01095 [Ignavibacteriaceae bacterium]|nr:hypothetical protein [Ignavibacteriaceae bacterium]